MRVFSFVFSLGNLKRNEWFQAMIENGSSKHFVKAFMYHFDSVLNHIHDYLTVKVKIIIDHQPSSSKPFLIIAWPQKST